MRDRCRAAQIGMVHWPRKQNIRIFYGMVKQGPFNKPHRIELAIYKKRRGIWRKVYDRETSVLHRFTGWLYLQFLDR